MAPAYRDREIAEMLKNQEFRHAHASPARSHDLQPVLSSDSDPSWAREGRARSSTSLGNLRSADHRDPGSRRTSPSLRTTGGVGGGPAGVPSGHRCGVDVHCTQSVSLNRLGRRWSGCHIHRDPKYATRAALPWPEVSPVSDRSSFGEGQLGINCHHSAQNGPKGNGSSGWTRTSNPPVNRLMQGVFPGASSMVYLRPRTWF